MEKAYRMRITNRWFGAPCSDRVDDLGIVWFTPFTIEKAREVVQLMGFIPKFDDLCDAVENDMEIGTIEVYPTRAGAESAWIEFWR